MSKQLTKRQLAVIEDIFSGELGEQAVLDKHKVSKKLYNKWQSDVNFIEHFDGRIAAAYRQSTALIASYASLAAAKLIALTNTDKPEVVRRACLDIIQSDPSLRPQVPKPRTQDTKQDLGVCGLESFSITEQTAGKLLAVLAEEKTINKL